MTAHVAFSRRALWKALSSAVSSAFLLGACGSSPSDGDSQGAGGTGPLAYSTDDDRVPNFWLPYGSNMSDYVGAGGDSQQPPLQPRPALHADRVGIDANRIASLAIWWPARSAELRVAPVDSPNQETGVADLTMLAAAGELDGDGSAFFRRFESAKLMVFEGKALVVLPSDTVVDVAVYDITTGKPAIGAHATLPFGVKDGNVYVDPTAIGMGHPRVVRLGSTLVFEALGADGPTFEIVSLADPTKVAHLATLKRGPSDYVGPLKVAGSIVMSERRVPSPGEPGKVSYWLDRVDLSDVSHPKPLVTVNVPAPIVASRSDAKRFLTLGFARGIVKGVATCCPGAGGCSSSAMTDECEVTTERTAVVDVADDGSIPTLDSAPNVPPLGLAAIAANATGAFGVVGWLGDGNPPSITEVVSVGSLASAKIQIARKTIATQPDTQLGRLEATASHLAFTVGFGASVVMVPLSGESFGAEKVASVASYGAGPGSAVDLALTADKLFVATGVGGILSFDLP